MDLDQIQKTIDKFYSHIFSQKDFMEILEEIASNKINEDKKQFFIKDSAFKFLDMNYYYSPMIKSKAEIYISDFKKDSFKMYNSYYYSIFKSSIYSFYSNGNSNTNYYVFYN